MKLRKLFKAALVIGAGIATAANGSDRLEVVTRSGTVRGEATGTLESWLGIPYAAPPVGALRWQPPEPAQPWTVTRKANAVGSSCAQNGDLGPFAKAGGSEDCLYLNVFRSPSQPAGTKLPVFFWIHGGALKVGQGADYNPQRLVEAGSVVVTLNYRLGLFGFLAHRALDREGHPFGNYGLMDQQAALKWVQQNISAFGGDPQNVTIAGESSGGNSVMAHVLSPRSRGLFQHAIAMSGAALMLRDPGFGSSRPLESAEATGAAFSKAAGCADKRDVAACLRALPAKRILDLQGPWTTNQILIDGAMVPMHPGDMFSSGQVNPVTLIAGNTRDEGRFFTALQEQGSGHAMTAENYPAELSAYYGPALQPAVLREYPLSDFDSPSSAYSAAVTDSLFACPGLKMEQILSRTIPVYAYEFADRTAPSYIDPTTFPLLAAHTFELGYLFPGFRGGEGRATRLNPLQQHLANWMVGVFANSAEIASRAPQWERFRSGDGNVMSLSLSGPAMTSGRTAKEHHCTFWDTSGLY